MDHMVLDVESVGHQVADQFGIGRNSNSEGILYGSDGGERMGRGADAAHAADEGPRIARIAAFQDGFDAAYHGAGTEGIRNDSIVYFNFDPQVTFNSGDGIYNDSFSHDV